ncbi:MAG: hypothetical protein LBI14_11720 [Treponema sp.]|jgi:hypothetical protein|nr:hypothetical protein [Treponema sp.]
MNGLLSMRRASYAVLVAFYIIFSFSFPFCVFGQEEDPSDLDVEALKRRITEEARPELISLDIADSSVSLQIFGYWKGTFSAGLGMTFSPLGNFANFGDTSLFAQEADLTLSLWIRERWFVEASFLDDYHLNTYSAGYQGFPGEFVQYVGIGNTGLNFPAFPYLDLGEAAPSSFGFYSRFGGSSFTLHGMARYDLAFREEKVFTGGSERNFSYADITRPLRGVSFVLPDENLSGIPVVYIEDRNGTFSSPSDGRRWRILEPSEYSASSHYGLLELSLGTYTGGSLEPNGMIAVAYSVGGNIEPWNTSLGKYGLPSSGNDKSFLGDAQKYFNGSSRTINLVDYPQSGGNYPSASATSDEAPGQVVIDGIPALVIYERGTFSPFERQNQYLVSANGQAALVRLSSGEVLREFEFVNANDSSENSSARIIRLIRDSLSFNGRDEKDRWPLAAKWPDGSSTESWPELYLPGRQVFTADLGIRVTSYGAAELYHIGTDIVPGSVQVFRDGILDPDFVYNSASGSVTLRKAAGSYELIRISYLKRSQERKAGSIAVGLGAVWNLEGAFSSGIGIGVRWNLSGNAYSEEDLSNPGTVGLGAEARWNYDRLKAGLTLGFSYEQPDSSGLYRAAGMEGNDVILRLPAGESFISPSPSASYPIEKRAPLVYRNYRDQSAWNNSSLLNIESTVSVISGMNGPYPAMDSAFGSRVQILAAEFVLTQDQWWTGFEVPLGLDSSLLERAKQIEVPFRFLDMDGETDKLTIIFQAGSLAGRDSLIPENAGLVIEKILYSNPYTIVLTDDDRRKLQGSEYIRIIITAQPTLTSGQTISGRLILAPPVIKGAGFRPITINGTILPATDNVEVWESIDSSLEASYGSIIQRLHPDGRINRVLNIAWKGFDLSTGTGAGADARTAKIPLNNYQTISFFIQRPKATDSVKQDDLDDAVLRFILGRGPQSYDKPGETVLDAVIPLTAFDEAGVALEEWAKVELRYLDNGIYINGKAVTTAGATLTYNPGLSSENSSYLAFMIMPISGSLPAGEMAIDEVILENAVSSYHINAGGSVDWSVPGVIVSVSGMPLLSDFVFSASMESGSELTKSFGLNSRNRAEISILGLRLTGNFSFSLHTSSYGTGADFYWRAGHSLSRSWKYFSFRELFNHAPFDSVFDHSISIALTSVVRYSLSADFSYNNERYVRSWQSSLSTRIADILDLTLSANAIWNERTVIPLGMNNYGAAWLGSFASILPNSGSNSYRREGRANFGADLATTPLGFRLNAEGSSIYSSIEKNHLATFLLRMDFPLTLNTNSGVYRISFREEREWRRNLLYEGFDFQDDLKLFGKTLGDSLPLMFNIPFYSFFAPMRDRLTKANSGLGSGAFLNSGRFTERFEISLQMPANYGVSSIYIPSRVSMRINRLIDQKMDIFQDTLNFGGGLYFSSVNLFGAMGALPVFKFYAADQISHSIDASISIPRGERIGFRIQATQDFLFHGFSGAELSINNILTVSSSSYSNNQKRWTDSLSLAWFCPMEKSLLGTIYAAIMRMAESQSSWLTLAELSRSDYDLYRRESLEFVYEYTPGNNTTVSKFSLTLGHESHVRVMGTLNLSAYAKLNLSNDFSNRVFSFLATIGTSLTISF